MVLDQAGRPQRIPFRPTGADLLQLERRGARETARRPLEELLEELEAAAEDLLALERGLEHGG